MLLVDPARGARPRGRRGEGPPPPPPADPRCAAAGPCRPVAGDASRARRTPDRRLRYLAGLHAEKARLDIKTMVTRGPRAALEHGRRHADAGPRPGRPAGRRPPPPVVRPGHEPADRPGARAGGHGPPGRARPAPGAARRAAARQPGADAAPRPPGRRRPRRRCSQAFPGPGRPARRDLGPRSTAPPGSTAALDRLAARRRSRPPAAGRSSSSCAIAASRLDRLPIPSVLAVGAVNTALTEAGLRGRADVARRGRRHPRRPRARRWPSRPARRPSVPWLAVELAAELAGHARRGGADAPTTRSANLARGVRRRPPQDARPDGHQHRRLVHRRPAVRDDRARRRPGPRAASRPRRPGAGRIGLARHRRARGSGARRGRGHDRRRRRRRTSCRTPGSPASRPTARRIASPRRSRARSTLLGPSATRRTLDAASARYRAAVVGPGSTAPSSATAFAFGAAPDVGRRPRRRRARPRHRPPLRRLGDVGRRPVAGGPPGADDRDPAGRRRREHRRGRRGSRPGTSRPRAASATTRGSSRSRRPGSASPRRTSPAPTSSRSRSPRARSPARAASSRRRRRRPTSPRSAAASRG